MVVGWLLARSEPFDFVAQLTTADDLLAAQLLLPECTSTLRTEVFERRISQDDADGMLERLLVLPLTAVQSAQQFSRALELAERFAHRHAYDMQYLAAAQLSDAEIVTMDRGLRHAATEIGVPVRFLQ